jgi:hypothetical protein
MKYAMIAWMCATSLASAPHSLFARQNQPPATPDRWESLIDFGFNGAIGNNQFVILSSGFRLKHLQKDQFGLEWSGVFRYGESEGDVIARNARMALSFDLGPKARWSPFLYGDIEYDRFRKLDLRSSAGFGLNCNLVRTSEAPVSLSAAILHNYENYTEPRSTGGLMHKSDARFSARARSQKNLAAGLRLENTSWYRSVWDHAGDYNLESITKFSVRLSRVVGMSLSHTYRRDSTPLPGVKTDDQIFLAGLTLSL